MGANLHLANKRDGASELLVDHEAEDAHLGGAAVVELDGALLELGLLIEGIPAEVEGAVAEVTGELGGSGDVLHDSELEEADEEDDLDGGASGDGVGAGDGGPAVGEGVEGITGVVEVSGKVDSGTGDDVAEEGLKVERGDIERTKGLHVRDIYMLSFERTTWTHCCGQHYLGMRCVDESSNSNLLSRMASCNPPANTMTTHLCVNVTRANVSDLQAGRYGRA